MVNVDEALKEQKEEPKPQAVGLRLITGGREPEDPNWLGTLAIGTVFLTRVKTDATAIDLAEYVVHNIVDNVAVLLILMTPQGQMPIWVDPHRFSNKFRLISVIRTQPAQEQGVEEEE